MGHDKKISDSIQEDLRIMSMLKSIGQAYQRGTIIVNAGSKKEHQHEAATILTELAKFADRVQAAESRGKAHGDGTQ